MYKKITTVEEYSDSMDPSLGPVASSAPAAPKNNGNGKKYAPCIRTDIPLMIRLLEFAREDASSDMDLHALTAEMIAMSEEGRVLTMNDYGELIEAVEASAAAQS
jgi:hypothetical protein